MAVNIEKMRADMLTSQKLLAWETKKSAVQLMAAIATSFAAGAGVLGLILHLAGKT
jgi:hypothetical protein